MPEVYCSACGQPIVLPPGFKMPPTGDTIESVTHTIGGPVVIVAKVRMLYCQFCADRLLVSQFLKRAKPAKAEVQTGVAK